MDFFTAIRIAARRWYVILSVLIVAGVLGSSVVSSVPTSYRARATVMLINAPAVDEETQQVVGNPIGQIDYSTTVLASIMAQIMNGGEVRKQILDAGAEEGYAVNITGQTPVLEMQVVSTDEQASLDSIDVIIAELAQQLEQSQRDAGAPESTWISALTLVQPTEADVLMAGKIRAAAAVAAVGLAAAFSLAFLTESIAAGRRRRQEERQAALDAEEEELGLEFLMREAEQERELVAAGQVVLREERDGRAGERR